MTSRKCRVVTMAAGGKRRVISAFVATVVPCENSGTSDRSIPASSTPASTPSSGSEVDGTLATRISSLSSSSTQTSVNVPPTSTATLVTDRSLSLASPLRSGLTPPDRLTSPPAPGGPGGGR